MHSFRTRGFVISVTTSLLFCLVVWLGLTTHGRSQARATLLVLDLLSRSETSLLQAVTERATAEIVTIPSPAGSVEAQLYRPAGDGPHGAFILVLGYPSNITDPQLNRFATDLARLGFVVLVPRLPGLSIGELVAEDMDVLVSTFEWLATQPEVDPKHIGFGGFCVGSSLALVAAEDARINEEVALVNVFGGYYDLPDLLRATAVHSALYREQEYPWQPSHQTIALFAQNLLLHVNDPAEQEILKEHFAAKKMPDEPPESLSLVGSAVYSLLTITDPVAMDRLLAQIPPELADPMTAVSPSAHIERLQAKVFIMHDVSDPYVPVTESYRLADAITDPKQKVRADFVLFEHVRPKQAMDRITLIREGLRLVSYLGQVFNEITPGD